MGHLQSDNQYKRDYFRNRAQFRSQTDQPGFIHAKKSQQLISDVNYRQRLHQYTCDPEQLNLRHAKQAYKLQSDVSTLGSMAKEPVLGKDMSNQWTHFQIQI